MELTPRLLTEVEFSEQWRGYSRSDVDDFLERLAVAVGELQDRLRQATERAAAVEQSLLERADDDEIKRTLVLAQRTAVSAVEEARAEAERILADAHQRAREQLSEAEERVAAFEADLAERTRVELGTLAERRAELQADAERLAAFTEEHRARLRDELQRQLAWLDGAEQRVSAPPAVSDVVVPGVGEPEAAGAEEQDEPQSSPWGDERDAGDEPGVDTSTESDAATESIADSLAPPLPAAEPRPPTDDEVAQARDDLVEALRRAGVDELLEQAASESGQPSPGRRVYDALADDPTADDGPTTGPVPAVGFESEPEAERGPGADDDTPGHEPRTSPWDDEDEGPQPWRGAGGGEPTGVFDVLAEEDDDVDEIQWRDELGEAPVPVGVDDDADEDDPFLAELRRAITDTEPLGPRDASPAPPAAETDAVDGGDDGSDGGRFRLRRTRP